MNIFSRRKRLLNQIPARTSGSTAHGRGRIRSGLRRNRARIITLMGQVSGRARFRKIFWRNRAGAAAMPKMSSRRQFHRALRRHPAWPLVMAEAEARAKAHKEQEVARARAAKEVAQRDRAAVLEMRRVSRRNRFRRILNRDRTNVTAIGTTSSGAKFRRALWRNQAGAMATGRASGGRNLRRNIRRNRVLLVTLLAVGGVVALLTGIGGATHGNWGSSPVWMTTPVPLRFGAATAFDYTREETLIFGGFSGTQPPAVSDVFTPHPTTFDDTWSLTLGIRRNPNHSPSARGFASMAYDQARRNMVLFGGAPYRSNAVSGETWTWDGVDWTLRNPPEPRPPARQNASMVYDAHRKVVVLFGGQGLSEAGTSLVALNDTWVWNGSTWTKLNPPESPEHRHSAAMAYDVCRGEAVMFGGVGPPPAGQNFTPQPGQTWTWNGANWTKKSPTLVVQTATPLPGQPPPRIGASMVYSNVTGRILLYGGFTTNDLGQATVATDENLWMWDGTGWEREVYTDVVVTALINVPIVGGVPGINNTSPPPRTYTSFAFDPVRGSALLFSGTPADPNPSAPQVALPDYWSYSEGNFTTGLAEGEARRAAGLGGPRHCSNPVPIPPETNQVELPKPPQLIKTQTREEIQEIGRLPVVRGTDWPADNREPNLLNPTRPNPNYKPAPDCPNRTGARLGDNDSSYNHLLTDPKRNRVYQFYVCDAASPNHKLLIQAYDGTTLKPLGSVIAPITDSVLALPRFSNNSNSFLHDAGRGRFLLRIDRNLHEISQDLIEQGTNPVVARYTLPPGPPHPATGAPAGISGIHLFNHPKTGRAKLLISYVGFKVDAAPVSRPQIAQWDVDGNRQNMDWQRIVEACNISGTYNFELNAGMRVGDWVYTSCIVTSGGQSAVVKIPVVEVANDPVATDGEDSPTTLPVELFPGPFFMGSSIGNGTQVQVWADLEKGRMLLLSQPYNGSVLWQFDVKASAFVGRAGLATVGLGLSQGFGFDPEAGRLYILESDHQGNYANAPRTQGGLLVVDTHLTPLPQAINFAQYTYPGGPAIATLPAQPDLPRRVFVRRVGSSYRRFIDGRNVSVPDEDHYKVLADLLPLSEPPEIGRLDTLTIPVAESPGKTEANFNAEGSGYGIRLRSVGGVLSALRPPPQFPSAGTESLTDPAIRSFGPTCFFPDRELMAGWVSQARLSDLEGSARSLGLDADPNTKFDLEGLTNRCLPATASPYAPIVPPSAQPYANAVWSFLPFTQANNAAGSRLGWSNHFHEAECTGDSSNVTQTTGADASSSATCKQKDDPKDDWVSGTARGALGPGSAGFSVGEGSSDVVVKRDPVKGVVVTATAEAKDIKLPTGLTIGYVKTEAVAWSNGRPGEGRTSFTRTICNVNPPLPVVNPANSDPRAPNTGCLNENQQKQMAADFNARMGVNGKMILPAYDPDFFRGSPGGYIAGVTKPKATEVEDQLLARDTQREVSGMEIVFYKDNTEYTGRQVLQLAAVRAVSTYGVQCASEFIYSSTAKNCVALSFEDDPVIEEFFEEEASSTDDTAFNSYEGDSGSWTPIATAASEGLALGRRLGRFIENLPVIRRLPIRQMGEALMAASVWMLLGLPLLLASRRFALNLARRGN